MANLANTGEEITGLVTRLEGTSNPFQLVYERVVRAQPFNLGQLQDDTTPRTGQVWPRGRN